MCGTVWHGREAISDNGRHWRPLTFHSKLLPPTVQFNATYARDTEAVRVGGKQMSRFVAHCYHKQDSVMTGIRHLMTAAAVA